MLWIPYFFPLQVIANLPLNGLRTSTCFQSSSKELTLFEIHKVIYRNNFKFSRYKTVI